MLAETLSNELLRASQHGERDSVRELTAATVNAAKPLGLYRPYESLKTLGDIKCRRSGESEVFSSADNASIIKVKDPTAKESIKRTTPTDWFYEHIIHNILFPDAAHKFSVNDLREAGFGVIEGRPMQELLRDPDRSITDIAYDLCWSSSNYFCAVFKKYTNVSPLHYRKLRMQRGDDEE